MIIAVTVIRREDCKQRLYLSTGLCLILFIYINFHILQLQAFNINECGYLSTYINCIQQFYNSDRVVTQHIADITFVVYFKYPLLLK